MQQPDDELTFNEARHRLLEVMAQEWGAPLLAVVREYNKNTEFARRVDLTAMELLSPTSNTIH